MNAAAGALTAAKASGDLGRIGAASQQLQDAVNAYLALAGTSEPSAGPAPPSQPAADRRTGPPAAVSQGQGGCPGMVPVLLGQVSTK